LAEFTLKGSRAHNTFLHSLSHEDWDALPQAFEVNPMTVSEFLPAAAGASDMTFKVVPRKNAQIVGHQVFVAWKLKQISVAFQNPLFPMRSFTKGPFASGLKVRLA
jgi:hypothetical protein